MEETTKPSSKENKLNVKSSKESLKLIARWEKTMLVLIVAAILGVFIWVFFGRLETTITGMGLVSTDGQVEQAMVLRDIIVTDVLVDVGDKVQSGQPVVKVYPVSETTQLSTAEISKQAQPIIAESDAYTTEMLVSKRDFVEKYNQIASFIGADEKNHWVVYMSVKMEDGQKIAEGMKADIEVEGCPVEEYGNLTGVVREVAHNVQDEDSLFHKFGNHYYAEAFLQYGKGLIEIELDCDDEGNPIFTSGISGENLVPINSAVQVLIHVKEGHPIDFISGK